MVKSIKRFSEETL